MAPGKRLDDIEHSVMVSDESCDAKYEPIQQLKPIVQHIYRLFTDDFVRAVCRGHGERTNAFGRHLGQRLRYGRRGRKGDQVGQVAHATVNCGECVVGEGFWGGHFAVILCGAGRRDDAA